ncbi:hypothetical protein ACWGB8_02545 [Kitasatospora sp. NPDC054939]
MGPRALTPEGRRTAPVGPPPDRRPVLLLAGGDAGDDGDDAGSGWARRAIGRRYRLLPVPDGAVPPGAVGVCAFRPEGAAAALALAERAGLPAGPLRTAGLRTGGLRTGGPGTAGADAVVVSAVLGGRPAPLFTARPDQEPGADDDSGRVVDAADGLTADPRTAAAVRAAHRRLGGGTGFTATALRLGAGGYEPAGVRGLAAGDPLLRAGALATGTDLAAAWADLAAGAEPDLAPRRRSAAAVRLLHATGVPQPGAVLVELTVDQLQLPGGIWEVRPLAGPGSSLRARGGGAPGTPLVLAVAVGEDAAACRRALDLLPRAVRLRHRPAAPTHP